MSVPNEILRFIDGNWGKSMLIKGSPGAGKTTMALEIMEYGLKKNGAIYISTRQGDQSLYNQFPWLREEDYKNAIVDSSYEFLEKFSGIKNEDIIEQEPDAQKIAASRKFVESIRNGVESSLSLSNISRLEIKSREFMRLIYMLKVKYKPGLILVIDSIEGIIQRWSVPKMEFIDALQKDLVEASRLNVILVSEIPSENGTIDPVEYLVDAVVRLDRKLLDERIMRLLIFEKLRFVESKNSILGYTLAGGRFNYFDPNLLSYEDNLIPRTDGEKIKLGFLELDRLLNDEVQWDIISFESKNLPSALLISMLSPFVKNSIKKGMGVVLICDPNSDSNYIYRLITGSTESSFNADHLRIGDFSSEIATKKFFIPLGYENQEIRNRELTKSIVDLMDTSSGIIFIYRMSGLERIIGRIRSVNDLTPILSPLRHKKDKLILINDRYTDFADMQNLGNYNFKAKLMGNILVFYSESPFTPYYSLQRDSNGKVYLLVIE